MTAEHFSLLEAGDFKAIRVVCLQCHSSLTIHLNQTIRVPEECPACKNEWRSQANINAPTNAEQVGNALKKWIQFEQEKKPSFTIRFEMKQP